MIGAWLSLAAGAQQVSEFAQEGADCGANYPIAGTTGATNSAIAIRTNQSTYSATAFAKRALDTRLARHGREDDGWVVDGAWDHNQTYGAIRVAALHPAAGAGGGCDARFGVASRPIDLWSSNVGFTAVLGRFGLFYASSITFAGPVAGDNFIRVGQSLSITPFYALGFAGLVPWWDLITVNPTTYDIGAAGLSLDWIGGGNVDLDALDVSLGYTATGGGYVRLAEHTVGLNLSGTFSPTADYGYIALGGLDRLELGQFDDALEAVGLTTFEFLDRPFAQATFGEPPPVVEIPPALQTSVPRQRWRTTRLAQQNVMGILDVDAEYRLQPSAAVQRAIVGLHTVGFHRPRLGWQEAPEGVSLLVQGGAVGMLPHYALGVEGGLMPSARVAVGAQGEDGRFLLTLMYNDPSQIALFPFGEDMIGWSLNVDGSF